jgi:hypothetical protein
VKRTEIQSTDLQNCDDATLGKFFLRSEVANDNQYGIDAGHDKLNGPGNVQMTDQLPKDMICCLYSQRDTIPM